MKIIDSEQQKEKQINRNENSLREPWDNSKQTNIHIIGVPEGEEIQKGIENVFEEIMRISQTRRINQISSHRNYFAFIWHSRSQIK